MQLQKANQLEQLPRETLNAMVPWPLKNLPTYFVLGQRRLLIITLGKSSDGMVFLPQTCLDESYVLFDTS